MQKRKSKEKETLFKPWYLIVLVLGGAVMIAYSVQVMQKAYTVDPEKVYAEYFANSRDRIHDLQGGGDITSVFDIWLTFQCPDIVRFKNPAFFTAEQQPVRAWHYLIEKYPHEPDLTKLSDLEGWTMCDHPDPVRVVNSWLVGNKRTNRYWFRTWGRK